MSEARARLVSAALRLFQERGYHGAGLSEILAAAGTPKGSLYHAFPGGKAELAAACIAFVRDEARAAIAAQREAGITAREGLRRTAQATAAWMAARDWRQGPLFSAIAQGGTEPLVAHALSAATAAIRSDLDAWGGAGFGDAALAALEGGAALARGDRDGRALLAAADAVARALDAARQPS